MNQKKTIKISPPGLILLLLLALVLVSAAGALRGREPPAEGAGVQIRDGVSDTPAPEEAEGAPAPQIPISHYEEAVSAIREGLRRRDRNITLSFACGEESLEELSRRADGWMEEALAETDSPQEGDYIRYQYGGYHISCRRRGSGDERRCTVEIMPDYYTSPAQEEAVTARLAEIYRAFAFTGETTELEKIETVYRYVCENVRYDQAHQDDPDYHIKSTAYGALLLRSATCQGYCVTLYRMLRELGLNCRVITGVITAGDAQAFHAWNIVETGGLWYYLDATWDAGEEAWVWFLRGGDSLEGRQRGEEFAAPDFLRRYPMAQAGIADKP